jgi:hypothetical protein
MASFGIRKSQLQTFKFFSEESKVYVGSFSCCMEEIHLTVCPIRLEERSPFQWEQVASLAWQLVVRQPFSSS